MFFFSKHNYSKTVFCVKIYCDLSKFCQEIFLPCLDKVLSRFYQNNPKNFLANQDLGKMFQALQELSRSCMTWQVVSNIVSLGLKFKVFSECWLGMYIVHNIEPVNTIETVITLVLNRKFDLKMFFFSKHNYSKTVFCVKIFCDLSKFCQEKFWPCPDKVFSRFFQNNPKVFGQSRSWQYVSSFARIIKILHDMASCIKFRFIGFHI